MTGPLRAFYLAFCLVIGCVVWMLAYGLGFAVPLSAMAASCRRRSRPIPSRRSSSSWLYADSPVLQTSRSARSLPALAVAGIVAYAGLRRHSSPLGDARFQTMMSLRRGKWFRRKGHILGRFGRQILRVNDDRHHLVIGPTRSGKGAGYVIPNALTHEGSMIVTDLKGEIFQQHRRLPEIERQPGLPVRAGLGQDAPLQSARFHPA